MVEVVNSNKIKVICTGRIPAIQIDGSMDVNVTLNEESKGTRIISSKSSQMNVLFQDSDGELKSQAIPCQFETSLVDGKLVTVPTDLA